MDVQNAINTYENIDESPFCIMFDLLGSDKGISWHQYSRFYYSLLRPLRDSAFNLFELGIGTTNQDIPSHMPPWGSPAASHIGWRGYFKNAHIYGADIDKTILCNGNRLTSFYCDQTDEESIEQLWKQPELQSTLFYVMIDDGLHAPRANFTFFINSIHKLARGGVYIIEDISDSCIDLFKIFMEDCKRNYPELSCYFFEVKTNNGHHPGDNNLFVAYKN